MHSYTGLSNWNGESLLWTRELHKVYRWICSVHCSPSALFQRHAHNTCFWTVLFINKTLLPGISDTSRVLKIDLTAEFNFPYMRNNVYVLSGKLKVLECLEKDQKVRL